MNQDRKFILVKINKNDERIIEKIIERDLTLFEALEKAKKKNLSYIIQGTENVYCKLINS